MRESSGIDTQTGGIAFVLVGVVLFLCFLAKSAYLLFTQLAPTLLNR